MGPLKGTHRPDNMLWFWLGAALLVNLASIGVPFFWDNILNSRTAQFYLQTGFESLTVPSELDAGHPPFFSLYLAAVWSFTGKSLWAAHLAMLPFLLGLHWLAWDLGKKLLPEKAAPWAGLVLFLDPALVSQSIQITPDIALLFFFLLAIKSIWDSQKLLLLISMIGLSMMSMRGILSLAAIGFIDIMLNSGNKWSWLRLKNLWPYLTVAMLACTWLVFHYVQTGWLFRPPAATYGGHRNLVGWGGIFRNLLVMVWRLLDHGRIFPLACLAWAIWKRQNSTLELFHSRKLGILLVVPLLVWGLVFLPFSNPIGHRYFLPAYVFLGWAMLGLFSASKFGKWNRLGLALVILGWLSGHLWVYPDSVAKGWDATLAHLPYHGHRIAALDYMERQGIQRHDVCTDFPAAAAPSFIDPSSSDSVKFEPLPNSLNQFRFVLYSNVCNGFSDAMLEDLSDTTLWETRFQSGHWPVRVVLFEKIER